jgi:cytochrome c5
VAAASLAWVCSGAAATQSSPATSVGSAATAPAMAADKALFEQACGLCHGVDYATQMRNSRAGWSQIVDRMTSNGLNATDEQKQKIIDYLAKSYPSEP